MTHGCFFAFSTAATTISDLSTMDPTTASTETSSATTTTMLMTTPPVTTTDAPAISTTTSDPTGITMHIVSDYPPYTGHFAV